MPFVSTDNARFDSSTNAYQLTIAENSAVGTLIGRIAFEGETVMAVTGYADHGISLFEIDLDDPGAANPLLTPMPEM